MSLGKEHKKQNDSDDRQPSVHDIARGQWRRNANLRKLGVVATPGMYDVDYVPQTPFIEADSGQERHEPSVVGTSVDEYQPRFGNAGLNNITNKRDVIVGGRNLTVVDQATNTEVDGVRSLGKYPVERTKWVATSTNLRIIEKNDNESFRRPTDIEDSHRVTITRTDPRTGNVYNAQMSGPNAEKAHKILVRKAAKAARSNAVDVLRELAEENKDEL